MDKIIFNRTKIIATVGPASNNKETLTQLIKTGADVFRLNFSHGTHEDHKKVIDLIREINKELNTNVSILQDLQGPKIRTQEVKEGTYINPGDNLIITTDELIGNNEKISTSYKSLCSDVEIGETILIDDGKIELRVTSSNGKEVGTQVVYGGQIKSRKGINLPNTKVSAPSLTEKDKEDLEFGLQNDVDWIALSFVRHADDIYDLKSKIAAAGKDIQVIAKIEKPEALENIDEIIEATDALMVARGDLGVEIVMEEVPIAQKMLVEKCNKAFKPVIIATQMMESMIENPRPTRAETNDVANAVLDGADTVMLSAESAAGKYPIESVKSMRDTITAVENGTRIYHKNYELDKGSPLFINDNIIAAACKLSKDTHADVIVGMTKSGYTALRLAGHRPKAKIFVFTDDPTLLNRLNLVWGIRGFYYNKMDSTEETFCHVEEILKEKGHLHKEDVFINLASMPHHWKNRTNMIKINRVG